MKELFAALALFFLTAPAVAGEGTKYPAGTPASAIAVDQAIKAQVAGKTQAELLNACYLIDTKTGACIIPLVLDAGGGGGGAGGSGG